MLDRHLQSSLPGRLACSIHVKNNIAAALPTGKRRPSEAWLISHPGVEIISRDRTGAYADAARRGAPQARQIADRFHLLVNLQTAMERVFERKHELLKQIVTEEQVQKQNTASTQQGAAEVGKSELTMPTPTEMQRQARRAKRKDRYEEVMKLHEQGMSQTAIATLVGLNRNTVHSYIQAPEFREQVRPNRHKSKLDPYKAYLHQRLAEEQPSVTDLIKEIQEQGFRGSDTIVFDYLRSVRGDPAWKEEYQRRKQQIACGVSRKPLSARPAGMALRLQSTQAPLEAGLVATGAATHQR